MKLTIEPQMVGDGSYNISKRQDGGPITVYHVVEATTYGEKYRGVYATRSEALAAIRKIRKEQCQKCGLPLTKRELEAGRTTCWSCDV